MNETPKEKHDLSSHLRWMADQSRDALDTDRLTYAATLIDSFGGALKRIATPEAFYVATSHVDPEAYARMIYAQYILDGYTLDAARAKAEFETRERYPLRKNALATDVTTDVTTPYNTSRHDPLSR